MLNKNAETSTEYKLYDHKDTNKISSDYNYANKKYSYTVLHYTTEEKDYKDPDNWSLPGKCRGKSMIQLSSTFLKKNWVFNKIQVNTWKVNNSILITRLF